ncbi:hypothetical protein FRB90_012547 [Tulasnella sp. 427]|nr:hypothetical protein FRB90_012547 [Tulasnella sp. 427]
MSQPGSQPRISSESFSNAPRPLLAPDMLPPNSLSGKRLVFTSPLPPTRPTNNPAVASLRLLHSKTETSFATVSSKLDGLVSAIKHGHREMAELAQLQQDELAEVKRELQEHVSRAQVATQASFSSEVQSLKGHVDDALVSSSSLLNDAISKLSRLEDALYVQIQEQKVLETRIEALTQKLVESHDSAVNNHQLRHELDSRLLQMQRELHRNFCSEISKLSEKLNRFAPAGDPNTLQPSICDSQTQHVATVNLNPHTYSSLDPSPDATAVNPSLIYRTPPTKPSKRSLKSNTVEGPVDELCDGLFELQDIDLPPTRPTRPVHGTLVMKRERNRPNLSHPPFRVQRF